MAVAVPDADEQLAEVPLQRRMAVAHKLVATTADADERKAMLAAALWPRWSPPLTAERQAQLGADVWGQQR